LPEAAEGEEEHVQPTSEEESLHPARTALSQGPTFDVVMRGYHRPSVDEYIIRLHEWLLETEDRADRAGRAAADALAEVELLRRRLLELEQHALQSPEAAGAVGERVAEILRASLEAGAQARDSAAAQAAKLVGEAEDRATTILETAERRAHRLHATADEALAGAQEHAAAMLREAEESSQATRDEAAAMAERMLEDARRRHDVLEEAINELARRRANALGELGRLQRYLADAAAAEPATDPVPAGGEAELQPVDAEPVGADTGEVGADTGDVGAHAGGGGGAGDDVTGTVRIVDAPAAADDVTREIAVARARPGKQPRRDSRASASPGS
jgi:cell division septum initiation protein DivIVA